MKLLDDERAMQRELGVVFDLSVLVDEDDLVTDDLPVRDRPAEVTEPAETQRRVGVGPDIERLVVLRVGAKAFGNSFVVHAGNVHDDTDNVKGTARSLLGVGSGRSLVFGTAGEERS